MVPQVSFLVPVPSLYQSAAHSVRMNNITPIPKRLPRARHFVREWRKHRGYTQQQLAEMIGVTDGAISQLERGDTNYTQPMLEALAEALSCEPADLLIRNPQDQSAVWSILDNLKAVDDEMRGKVVRAVRELLRTGTDD